ncbi:MULTISPECIES: hypothetical protein [Streptomyces]|uniref:Uncharacterized protein n=1 Tax=Streptomyces dengpaensis TaxID=2049881 RepID=A0ABM6SNX6_9ACTN|nr:MULTISPECIES: hypothetical protein [Streptomyces]AVH55863.1 hypothetical protein C4B68_08865 [Streptomyces dengpaensis]PIB12114.1 hypothetical protein B1C81_02800 [Streptomyces sp. HG99]
MNDRAFPHDRSPARPDDVDVALARAMRDRSARLLEPVIVHVEPGRSDLSALVEGTITTVVGLPGSPLADQVPDMAHADLGQLRSLLETFSAQFARTLYPEAPGAVSRIEDLPSLLDLTYDGTTLVRGVALLPGVDASVARTLWNGGTLDPAAFRCVEHVLDVDQPMPSVTVMLVHPALSDLERAVLERVPGHVSQLHVQSPVLAWPAVTYTLRRIGNAGLDQIAQRIFDWLFNRDKGQDQQDQKQQRQREIDDRQRRERQDIDNAQARERETVDHRQDREQQQIEQRQDQENQDIQQRQQRERDQLRQQQDQENQRVMDARERQAQQDRHQQEQQQQQADQQREQEQQRQRHQQENERINQQHQQERDRQRQQQEQERQRQRREQERERQGRLIQEQRGLIYTEEPRHEVRIFDEARGMPFDRDAFQRRLADIDFDALEPTASAKTLLRLRSEFVRIGMP